jgi:hypothetical protein
LLELLTQVLGLLGPPLMRLRVLLGLGLAGAARLVRLLALLLGAQVFGVAQVSAISSR